MTGFAVQKLHRYSIDIDYRYVIIVLTIRQRHKLSGKVWYTMNTYRIKESKKDSRLRFAIIFDSNGKRKERVLIGQGKVLKELGIINYTKECEDVLKNNWFAIYADGDCSMDFIAYSELIDFLDEYAQTIAD